MFNFHSKVVDIPQRAAIRACMTSPDDLMSKIDKATTECLGQDDTFDWDDFSELNTVELIFGKSSSRWSFTFSGLGHGW